MMHTASNRRFKCGDRVRCIRDPARGTGIIVGIWVNEIATYMGHNEWMNEYVSSAMVAFEHGDEEIALKELIEEKKIEVYQSLRPGDFIISGKKKQAMGLVIQVTKRLSKRPHVANVNVIILENGAKKTLSIQQDIVIIQRI